MLSELNVGEASSHSDNPDAEKQLPYNYPNPDPNLTLTLTLTLTIEDYRSGRMPCNELYDGVLNYMVSMESRLYVVLYISLIKNS